MRFRTLIFVSFILLFIATCGWKEVQGIGFLVWSDDDVEQAYVHSTWETETSLFGVMEGAKVRNVRHSLILQIQKSDGSKRRALYSNAPGSGGGDLYYMRSQGYVIMEFADNSGRYFEKISLNGQRQVVGEKITQQKLCDDYDIIPSPNGEVLAAVKHVVPNPYNPSPTGEMQIKCGNGTVSVEFFNAHNLNRLAGPFTWNITGLMEAVWSPAQELFIVTGDEASGIEPQGGAHTLTGNVNVWKIDPNSGSGPVTGALPSCLYPKTTSSNVSAAGVKIGPGPVNDPVKVISTNATSFGCN